MNNENGAQALGTVLPQAYQPVAMQKDQEQMYMFQQMTPQIQLQMNQFPTTLSNGNFVFNSGVAFSDQIQCLNSSQIPSQLDINLMNNLQNAEKLKYLSNPLNFNSAIPQYQQIKLLNILSLSQKENTNNTQVFMNQFQQQQQENMFKLNVDVKGLEKSGNIVGLKNEQLNDKDLQQPLLTQCQSILSSPDPKSDHQSMFIQNIQATNMEDISKCQPSFDQQTSVHNSISAPSTQCSPQIITTKQQYPLKGFCIYRVQSSENQVESNNNNNNNNNSDSQGKPIIKKLKLNQKFAKQGKNIFSNTLNNNKNSNITTLEPSLSQQEKANQIKTESDLDQELKEINQSIPNSLKQESSQTVLENNNILIQQQQNRKRNQQGEIYKLKAKKKLEDVYKRHGRNLYPYFGLHFHQSLRTCKNFKQEIINQFKDQESNPIQYIQKLIEGKTLKTKKEIESCIMQKDNILNFAMKIWLQKYLKISLENTKDSHNNKIRDTHEQRFNAFMSRSQQILMVINECL